MCAASERRASELARTPTATSSAMNPRISASAIASLPRSASAEAPCEWPACEWWLTRSTIRASAVGPAPHPGRHRKQQPGEDRRGSAYERDGNREQEDARRYQP